MQRGLARSDLVGGIELQVFGENCSLVRRREVQAPRPDVIRAAPVNDTVRCEGRLSDAELDRLGDVVVAKLMHALEERGIVTPGSSRLREKGTRCRGEQKESNECLDHMKNEAEASTVSLSST
jgi:hypothetical protein